MTLAAQLTSSRARGFMPSRRIALVVTLACVSVGVAACRDGQLTAPEHELLARSGRPLALPGTVFGSGTSPLVWTRGGEVVTKLSLGDGGASALVAVRPADGSVRFPAVPVPQPYVYYGGFDASETGTAYVVTGEGTAEHPVSVLYRATPGGSAVRLDSVRGAGAPLMGNTAGVSVVVAPGELVAAYTVAPDSLVAFTPFTARRRVVAAGCVSVVAISPDAGRVLCLADRATRSYVVVKVADGSRSAVTLPAMDQNATLRFRLDDVAPRVLVALKDVDVMDLATGSATRIWTYDPGVSLFAQPTVNVSSLSWSADGGRVAFWTTECLSGMDLTSCAYGQQVLQVFDLSARRLYQLAVIKGRYVPTNSLALSPDGREAAYATSDGGLYVAKVP